MISCCSRRSLACPVRPPVRDLYRQVFNIPCKLPCGQVPAPQIMGTTRPCAMIVRRSRAHREYDDDAAAAAGRYLRYTVPGRLYRAGAGVGSHIDARNSSGVTFCMPRPGSAPGGPWKRHNYESQVMSHMTVVSCTAAMHACSTYVAPAGNAFP